MNSRCIRAILLGGALLCPGLAELRAQENPLKNASDFNSVEYYDPPNQLQISSRLTGAEAVPQPDGLVFIKQFKLEMYATNGTLQYIVEAPKCIYDQGNGTASSAGHIKIRQADGQVELQGDGFLWRQDDEFLTISNHVQTLIIATKADLKNMP